MEFYKGEKTSMPNISGYVYYSANSTITPGVGIENVSIVLYQGEMGAVALTDSNGFYLFTNVPDGDYKIVESYGTTGSLSPVNYALLVSSIPDPKGIEPPLSALTVTPPALADSLNALSPNTLYVTLAGEDLTDQDFYDAPVGEKPILFTGVTLLAPNLITAADNGTFGMIEEGSLVNTIPAADPYPGVNQGFIYVQNINPSDGYFTISNTRRENNPDFDWWNVSDHDTKIETGRFMLINGDHPKEKIFTQTISVEPYSDYIFTGWVLNLLNLLNLSGTIDTHPQLSFEVTGSDGSILGYELLNSILETEIPVWYQNGFRFNSEGFTSVTVNILSEGAAAGYGNDFLIDNLALFQAVSGDVLSVEKSASQSIIYAQDATDFTMKVKVTNLTNFQVNHVFFQDILDPTLLFVPSSVTVNGSNIGYETSDPNLGFSLGSLEPNAVKIIEFHVTTLFGSPLVKNMATVSYAAASSGNGDIIQNTIESNSIYLHRLQYNFSAPCTNLTESIALEQAAIAHILNAEGEKMQAAIAMEEISSSQLLQVNQSIQKTVRSISFLEILLEKKQRLIQPQITGYSIFYL